MDYSQRYSSHFKIPHRPLYRQIYNDLQIGVLILQQKIKLQSLYLRQQKQIENRRIFDQNLHRVMKQEYRCHYQRALQSIQNGNKIQRFGQCLQKQEGGGQKASNYIKIQYEGANGEQESVSKEVLRANTQERQKTNKRQNKMMTLPTEPQKFIKKQQKQDGYALQDNFKTNRANNNPNKQNVQLYETPYQNLINMTSNSKIKLQASLIKEQLPQATKQRKSFIRTEYTPSTQNKLTTYYQNTSPKPIRQSLFQTPQSVPNSKINKIYKQALKKIKRRVQVSAVIYSQTKLSSKKHEEIHLFNAFHKENQLRNDLISKINNKWKNKNIS